MHFCFGRVGIGWLDHSGKYPARYESGILSPSNKAEILEPTDWNPLGGEDGVWMTSHI